MPEFFKKMFYPEHLVDPRLIAAELPSASSVYKRCLKLAWPAAVESVLIALMGLMDTVMVGSLGSTAISAVGITAQPKFLFMAFIFALNVGVTAMVARLKGEGDNMGCRRTLAIAMAASIAFSLIMTICAILFAEPILRLAGARDDFIAEAIDYFRIVMFGQFFGCIGMTINAAQRGVGNTKIAMRTNVAANIVNLIFNYLLINGIWIFDRLGVRGAAIATAIGSFIAFVISCACVLNKNNEISLICRNILKFDRRIINGVIKIGSSAFVEQVFIRIGFFTFTALVARLGTTQFATHEICMNIIHVSFAFADGFSVAATSLVGQGLGEKRADLAMIYARACQRCILLISVSLTLLFIFLRTQMITLFSREAEIIELGSKIVIIIAITCFAQTSQVVISGSLRGAGDSKYVAMSSFAGVTIIRPLISWLLCYPLGMGLIGAWIGLFADQFMRLILNFIRFANGKWTQIKV